MLPCCRVLESSRPERLLPAPSGVLILHFVGVRRIRRKKARCGIQWLEGQSNKGYAEDFHFEHTISFERASKAPRIEPRAGNQEVEWYQHRGLREVFSEQKAVLGPRPTMKSGGRNKSDPHQSTALADDRTSRYWTFLRAKRADLIKSLRSFAWATSSIAHII